MALEKCFSLRKAASILGVNRNTLKRMLMTELGLVLPELSKGHKNMIRESTLEKLINCSGPHTDFRLLRTPSKRSHVA